MNQTPFQAWKGKRPCVTHLKNFGCIAYALVNSQAYHKVDDKSEKCISISYCSQSKVYRLCNPISDKVIIHLNVLFDENAS